MAIYLLSSWLILTPNVMYPSLEETTDEVISKLHQENIPHNSEKFKCFRIFMTHFNNSQRDLEQYFLFKLLSCPNWGRLHD
jgi:hypothetical protein